MRATIKKRVFSEPDGRPVSLVYFGLALVLLSQYVYLVWILTSEDSSFFLLIMGVGFTLQGIAESRPESQRQTAGVLRLTAILVYLCSLIATVFLPGFLLG
ncbi:hypothetical protein [Halorussus aquaticus]|uniref:Uncharacterized protein n=1 Tax=Halorussus aquaticus TaxID=2953748 RepID=A0ABD5Q8P3_9EURY|nr:hypothetical protein [Halorussus aquaticus]